MNYRMADMIAADGIAEVLDASLGRESWAVNTDDHQFVWIFVDEVVKIRDNMKTVK
jgi:hypothetical protein